MKIAHLLAAGQPAVLDHDVAAHLDQRVDEPGAGGVQHDVLDDDVGARRDEGRDHREGGGGRIARHVEVLRLQLMLALDGDVVAVGLLLDA